MPANGETRMAIPCQAFLYIDYYNCKSLDIKEGVTTMGDECNPVG